MSPYINHTSLVRQIEAVLFEEYYHCVDCIDYDSEKNPSPTTTPEEWVERTSQRIAERIMRNTEAFS